MMNYLKYKGGINIMKIKNLEKILTGVRFYCLVVVVLNLFKNQISVLDSNFITYQYIPCFVLFFVITLLTTYLNKNTI